MSLICFGTSNLEGNKQFLIPFGLFFIIPTFVASAIWFVPEVCIFPRRKSQDIARQFVKMGSL